jgi:hypothetical protein
MPTNQQRPKKNKKNLTVANGGASKESEETAQSKNLHYRL